MSENLIGRLNDRQCQLSNAATAASMGGAGLAIRVREPETLIADLKEAAAEIERLRAKLAEADRRNQELNREMSGVRRSYRDAHKARLKLARQLDAAEAVVEPFANVLTAPDLDPCASIGDVITVGHLRAAAEWMENGDE